MRHSEPHAVRRGVRTAVGARTRRVAGSVSFPRLCVAYGLPVPEAEYRFHPTRKWRFDWAFREHKVAVEQEGAIWVNGRHTRGSGFVKDIEKYNAAAALGWRVLRGTPQQIASGDILPAVQQAIGAKR